MCRSSKPKPSGKTEDKYVPDCSLYRLIPYFGPVADFLFDNLSISIYLCPLVYIGFIVLLPIDAPPVAVLFLALSMSVAMDWAMGAAGINTIATLPVAMLRRPLLQSVCGKEGIREGGIPSSIRLGQGGFLRYLAAMVVVHHFLFSCWSPCLGRSCSIRSSDWS